MEYFQNKYNYNIDLDLFNFLDESISNYFSTFLSEKGEYKPKYFKNLKLYIVNLLINEGKCAIIKKKDRFSSFDFPDWHSSRISSSVIDRLKKENFITVSPGYRRKGYESGFSTVITATEKFYEFFFNIPVEIKEKNTIKISESNLPDITIRKKGKCKKYVSFKTKLIPTIINPLDDNLEDMPVITDNEPSLEFKHDIIELPIYSRIDSHLDNILYNNNLDLLIEDIEETTITALGERFEEIVKEMYLLNKTYFNRINLGFCDREVTQKNMSMISNVYLTRMFDDEMKTLGRLTQRGGNSYQNITREDRKKLTINEIKTKEVDYSTLHINILYSEENIQNPHQDIYSLIVKDLVGKDNERLRKIIKTSILVLLNAKSLKSYSAAMCSKSLEDHQFLKKKEISYKDIVESFKRVCPEISKYILAEKSMELMLKDSNLIVKVLFRLRSMDILGIPLHDSIICQEGNELSVEKIMQEEYKSLFNNSIKTTIK